ncbi:oligosaccharide flippase family protein [Enterococcus canintestini]|uniref:lipopolysaccharide biosynthesis protein n=1 Tax=Enterococcus canintestini TaxID=317010 RepID=UPI00288FECAE|nr:oligosaccharide flippase family protein [Enterococcus canintestini]MDT2740344.1 oligosaccharide flippase family protein [Enterococcus canintestini]
MNKYKKLASNSVLFAIGNFGSKLITFVMLPLYTNKLSTSDFGLTDLVLTTVSLLLPIFSMSIGDSILRFGLEKNESKKGIFSNGLAVVIAGSILTIVFFPFFYLVNEKIAFYLVLLLIVQLFQTLFSQFAKANDQINIFALNGMLLSFVTAFWNFIFLVPLNMGIDGYLLSIIIANVISNVWLAIKVDSFRQFDKSLISKKKIKQMLYYSFPLIPNSVALWATNAISRYFILFFLGAAANGLFAVAYKIPSMIGVLNTIFFQAWQLTVIEEYDSSNNSSFYTNVFGFYSRFLFLGVSGILVILKPVMNILVSRAFYESWEYIPFLLLTVVYSSFSTFFGNYYAASKETVKVLTTTAIGAVMNIFLLLLLIPIPFIGINGAGIASAISFFVIWIIRQKDTQRFARTRFETKNILLNHSIFIMQILSLYLIEDSVKLFLIQITLFILSIISNKKLFVPIIALIKRRDSH